MKNAHHRQYDSGTAVMDEFNTVSGFRLVPAEFKKLKQGMQAGDTYCLDDSEEFCAWGYPMDLGHF